MLYAIAHNIRSAHNVGSLFRTADGAGVDKLFLTGYSPAPAKRDTLYVSGFQKMIAKTALGAEQTVSWEWKKTVGEVLEVLKRQGFEIVALEQSSDSISYDAYIPKCANVALLLGNEPKGIDARTLRKCDAIVEIPMLGHKNSLNVSVAFGIAVYSLLKVSKKVLR